ncbi:MAG: F0F1 ATP synthase subunit delta [Rhizobiaceae bacterium]
MENSASQTTGIAKLYASSLFEVALAAKQLESVEKDLERFDSMMNASSDLKRLVRSPVFSAGDQLRAIEALISKAGITGLAANLIKVVARNRRLFIMPEMLGAFRKLLAQHRGAESAEVTVARPLSAAQEKELKAALKSSVGKDVAIDARVDPSLLGGMIVKIGSRQIDTSLRRKLSSLKLALKEVG